MNRKVGLILLLLITVLVVACGTNTKQEASEDNDTGSKQEEQEDNKSNKEQESEAPDYSVFTYISAEEVETFAKQVQKTVADQDWKSMSELVAYPITIGGKTLTDKNQLVTFMKGKSISEEFLQGVADTDCTNLFANYQGAMFGDGDIWISEVLDDNNKSLGLKVIAVNLE